MHFLALSILPLAVSALSINTHAPPPKPKHDGKGKLPFYDWEHRTTCKQDLLNPVTFYNGTDPDARYQVMVVGYAWDKTTAPTPDRKWNWNTTENAKKVINHQLEHTGYVGEYHFGKGQPDERGFTQFSAEFVINITYPEAGLNHVLNRGLHIGYDGFNPYRGIVCLDMDGEGPLPEEMPYMHVENERHLKKLQSVQLGHDRILENNEAVKASDTKIQGLLDEVPPRTPEPEMVEGDRKVQGLPSQQGGNSTS